jgi:hypothetical protein
MIGQTGAIHPSEWVECPLSDDDPEDGDDAALPEDYGWLGLVDPDWSGSDTPPGPVAEPDDGHEWFVDLPPVSASLFASDLLPAGGVIWDPCCGVGHILQSARAANRPVAGSDIVDRGWEGTMVLDFLGPIEPVAELFAQLERTYRVVRIVTNPPYGKGVKTMAVVDRSRELGAWSVAVVAQNRFLASDRRGSWFDARPPWAIGFLKHRPSMPPGRLWQAGLIKAQGATQDCCWLVWNERCPPAARPIRWI